MVFFAFQTDRWTTLRTITVGTALLLIGCSSKGEKEPVLVGHIAPFSGPQQTVGDHAKQGIILAVEECNQDDRRIDGKKVAVLHADSHGTAEALQAEADRLITVNGIKGLLALTTAEDSERLARSLESSGIALVVCNPVIAASNDSPLSVSLAPTQQGQALARFALGEDLKTKKVAVLVDSRSSVATAVAAALGKNWPRDATHAFEQWTYDRKEQFAELAGRVQKLAPEAVILASTADDMPGLRAALKSADVKAGVIFAGPETGLTALLADHDSSEGVYVATSYAPGEEASDEGKAFLKKYEERFHEAPDVNAVLAYEAAGLVFEALRQAKKYDSSDGPRKSLAEIDSFPGVTGPLLIKDHVLRRTALVGRVERGQIKVVKRYKPDD
ncbi:MAG: ABC transporter substrate-binding protein [Gemmataceae bacterium]